MSDDEQNDPRSGQGATAQSNGPIAEAPKVAHEKTEERITNLKNAVGAALKGKGRLVVGILILIVAAIALSWIVDKFILYFLSRSYVDEVAAALDLNKYLADALILLTFIALAACGRLLWSFSKRKRAIGAAGIVALLVGHSLVLWYGTRGSYFDQSGLAIKCYVLSRDGQVTFGERAGVDPTTGHLCRPVTAEMLERLKEYQAGKRPEMIADDPNPVFFDPRSGEPIIWYYKTKDNKIEIFDLMGFHPETGEELLPITKDVANEWKKQQLGRKPPHSENYFSS